LRVIAWLLSRVGSIHALNANDGHLRNSQGCDVPIGRQNVCHGQIDPLPEVASLFDHLVDAGR
jgi:hypothetical protein